jgi:serine protease Do
MGRICVLLAAAFALCSCNRSLTSANAGSEPRSTPTGKVTTSGPLLSYADVVDHIAPAVVTIRSSRRVRAPQQFPFMDDPFFRQFFGGGAQRRGGGGGTETEHALGSGVIVRADGHIITNHHVVDGAEDISVELNNRRRYSARLVGSDPASDLAVLKIGAGDLPLLQLGDSDKTRVGDVVLAVGNPLGVGETVTEGIISAKGRSTDTGNGSFQDFLQTDAPINQGNSGGALVNTRGELIGINSQILSTNGGNIGIGFAIPSNMAKNVMNQLIGRGKVQRGMLGIGIQEVTPDIARGLGLKDARGIVISSVTPGGPAEKAGLKVGDVIVKVNGRDVTDSNSLRNEIASTAPGSDVTLTISRDGNQQDIRARVGELTPESLQQADNQQGGGGGGGAALGIGVAPAPNGRGVVVQQVDPSGPAAQAGIQTGDVIVQVNRQPVHSAADVQSALQRSNGAPLLLIRRGASTVFIPVPLQ